tara:strand:+ start:583 stop:1023 length:441 start_codon:yes stop_codon:yes gene_type:complete
MASGCSIFVDEYQTNQKKVIEFLLSDLPIPEDSSIKRDSTVLLGNGDNVSGRIILDTSSSPAENLIFYSEEALASGWELMSSKVGEEITLIYFKNGRYATLEMQPKRSFGGFIAGSVGSSINISISHPDSVTLENPFLGLTENIPD